METINTNSTRNLPTNVQSHSSDDFDRFLAWVKIKMKKAFSFLWENRDWVADQYRGMRNEHRAYQCTREALQRNLEFEAKIGDYSLKVTAPHGNSIPAVQRPANLPNGQKKHLPQPQGEKKS